MKKIPIIKKEYLVLERELSKMVHFKTLTKDQYLTILSYYKPYQRVRFLQVVSFLGSLLVGLGIISFLASNWKDFGQSFQLGVLLGGILLLYLASMALEKESPIASKGLLYSAVFIFLASGFLLESIFSIIVPPYYILTLLLIGTSLLGILLRDLPISITANIVALSLITSLLEAGQRASLLWYLLPLFAFILGVYANKYLYRARSYHFFNLGLLYLIIISIMTYFDLASLFVALTIFALSIYWYQTKTYRKDYDQVYGLISSIGLVLAGFTLSFHQTWATWSLIDQGYLLSILFSLLLLAYLLYVTREGNFVTLLGIIMVIFKFYFDTFYDFLPKSIFFMAGGLLLLVFSYVLERMRRRPHHD